MTLWRLATALAAVAALAVGNAQAGNAAEKPPAERRLGNVSPGNVAACYTPFHNSAYPLSGGSADITALTAAIDDDFRILSQYVTHVRTYYAQHYGIEVAPIAAKYGLKLYLGAYLTSESWWNDEANAAANAIKSYSGTVEAVLTGNENLVNFAQRSWDIISKINDIKSRAGSSASNVKYGTVQRINEYVDSSFDWDIQQLNSSLDILGVNIYPFFTNSYDGNNPTALLDAQWNAVTSKYPRDKIRLTETGFPTAGAPSSLSPNVQPSLDSAVKYYQGVVKWNPTGYSSYPKFWFQAFDRRNGDPAATVDLELYFGFFTTGKSMKRTGFPGTVTSSATSGSGSFLVTTTSSCTIDEGMDYTGTDIGSRPSSTAEGCFSICTSFSGCGAFTWTSYNSGTCWLKSSKGGSTSNSAARSGVACTTSTCSIDEGSDYSGNDIASRPSSTAEGCFTICNSISGCGAFTWTSYNSGTCWLKSSKGSSTSNSAARSGVACSCNLGGLDAGVDYAGNDISNTYGANTQTCISICQNKSGCKAFTWSSFNGGTCWLKSAKGSTSSNSAVTSGVIC